MAGWRGKENLFSVVTEGGEKPFTDGLSRERGILLLLAGDRPLLPLISSFKNWDLVRGVLIFNQEEVYIPPSFLAEMEKRGIPLLFLLYKERADLAKRIEEVSRLKEEGLLHYAWEGLFHYWQVLLQSVSIEQALLRLEEWIGQRILLLTPSFHLDEGLKGNGDMERFSLVEREYLRWRRGGGEGSFLLLDYQGRNAYLFPIRSGEEELGFLYVEQGTVGMTDLSLMLVERAIPALSTLLFHRREIAEVHQKYRSQFLHDLLFNQLDSEESLIAQGKYWGWDFTARVLLLVVNGSVDGSKGRIDWGLIEEEIDRYYREQHQEVATLTVQGEMVVLLFCKTEEEDRGERNLPKSRGEALRRHLSLRHPKIRFRIGIGRSYPSNLDLFRSFQEGKMALEMGRFLGTREEIFVFDDLGVIRLFSYVHQDLLSDFYLEYLGELLKLDQENEGIYLKTLMSFFQMDGDVNKTADHLFVHPNTLRNRLKKIEQILQIDLNRYEDLLNLFSALKMYQMINESK